MAWLPVTDSTLWVTEAGEYITTENGYTLIEITEAAAPTWSDVAEPATTWTDITEPTTVWTNVSV